MSTDDAVLNCIDQLNDFAEFLSVNPVSTAKVQTPTWPQPMFWTGDNCSGAPLYPFNTVIPNTITITGTSLGSFYVPPGWNATFHPATDGYQTLQLPPPDTTPSPSPSVSPSDNPTQIPYLLSLLQGVYFANNTPGQPGLPFLDGTTSNVATIELVPPQLSGQAPYYINGAMQEWKYNMCTNKISTVMAAASLSSWSPGSPECDDFMDTLCFTGVKNTIQPYPECACLQDELNLRTQFCEGNPIFGVEPPPGCTGDNADFGAFVPVTCFGKRCSSQKSYKWGRMLRQNCNVTLCEQNISILGNNISADGSSTLWCGNKPYSLSPSVSNTPSPNPSGSIAKETVLPEFIWIIIGVAGLFLFVAVPLAIVTYSEASKREAKASVGQEWARLKGEKDHS